MKIRNFVGLPDNPVTGNPLLPNADDGTASGTGGAPSPAPTQPATASPTTAPAGPPAPGPHGFAEGVSLAELPVEQQAAYWRFHARKHEDAAKARADELAALRPKAEQYDALAEASRTDQERALETARTEAANATREQVATEMRDRYAPVLVQSRLESALAGRMTAGQVGALMPTLNVAALLDKDGLPDAERIAALVAAIPVAATVQPAPPPDLGAGRRTPVVTGIDGNAAYERRHGKKTPQA